MIHKDEITWQHMTHRESHQAAIVEHMRNSQQEAEYKVNCAAEIEALLKLRKLYPNDQKFGREVNKRLKAFKDDQGRDS